MTPVELPSHFERDRDVVAMPAVPQNMAQKTAVLAKWFRKRMGLISSRDAFDMVHGGMIEDCSVSTYDLYRETIWKKSVGGLKSKGVRVP